MVGVSDVCFITFNISLVSVFIIHTVEVIRKEQILGYNDMLCWCDQHSVIELCGVIKQCVICLQASEVLGRGSTDDFAGYKR